MRFHKQIRIISLVMFFCLFFAGIYCQSDRHAGTVVETETGMFGHLVDGRNSAYANNARVYLIGQCFDYIAQINSTQPLDSTTTDSKGFYIFKKPVSGEYAVNAILIDNGDTLSAFISCINYTSPALNLGTDTLQLPGRIQGKVLVSSIPFPSVQVFIPGTSYCAMTSDSGTFILSGLPPGVYQVRYSQMKLFDTTINNIAVNSDSTTSIGTITLKKNPDFFKGSIAGTVYGINNTPLQGVTVSAESTGITTVTNSSGTYLLPELKAGAHKILYSHSLYYLGTIDSLHLRLDEDLQNIKYTLNPRPEFFKGTIAGIVTDSSGNVIDGATVLLDNSSENVNTVNGGKFILPNVIAGKHTLSVSHFKYYAVTNDSVTLQINENLENHNIKLGKRPEFFKGSISGIVYDINKKSLIGVDISLQNSTITSKTDSTGKYVLNNVVSGVYNVVFNHALYKTYSFSNVNVSAGENTNNVNAEMSTKPFMIYGVIVDSLSRLPVEGLHLYTLPNTVVAITDQNGQFYFDNISTIGTYSIACQNRRIITKKQVYEVRENIGTYTDTILSVDTTTKDTTLVAYYPFNGDGRDYSGKANHGVNTGATPAPDRFGIVNQAMSFDGVNDEIIIPDNQSLHMQKFTIATWVKPVLDKTDQKIISKSYFSVGYGDEGDSYNLGIYGDRKLEVWFWNAQWYGLRSISAGTVLQPNTWYLVAATFDGASITTYVNGNVDRTVNCGARTISYTDTDVMIGYSYTGGDIDNTNNFFAGIIDEMRIYSRALSPQEILTLYNLH